MFPPSPISHRDNNARQGPRRRISASYTKRQGYPTTRWSVSGGECFSCDLTTSRQLFFDDERRNKEVESLGKRPASCLFASGAGSGFVRRGDLLFGPGWG